MGWHGMLQQIYAAPPYSPWGGGRGGGTGGCPHTRTDLDEYADLLCGYLRCTSQGSRSEFFVLPPGSQEECSALPIYRLTCEMLGRRCWRSVCIWHGPGQVVHWGRSCISCQVPRQSVCGHDRVCCQHNVQDGRSRADCEWVPGADRTRLTGGDHTCLLYVMLSYSAR